MKLNKHKMSKDSKKKKQEILIPQKDKIIQFNLSYDNLKCFINHKYPKTDRKKPSNKNTFNLTGNKKYREDSLQDAPVQVIHKIIRDLSPDPSRQASNSIIQQIERNGLRCVWKQIQQIKTEYNNSEEWKQQQLLQQTFSECSRSLSKNHSFSTIDQYSGYYSIHMRGYRHSDNRTQCILSNGSQYISQAVTSSCEYFMNQKTKYYDSNMFEINLRNIGNDPRTTLMIKNIPNKYTIQDLSNQIDYYFQNAYDFLYLPCDSKNNCNVGYGFINFVSTEILIQFYKKFHNQKWMRFRSQKICCLTYARLQGLESLIDHFQNSKVLNHKDKLYQPIIKDMRGCSKKIQNLIKQQKDEQSFVIQ